MLKELDLDKRVDPDTYKVAINGLEEQLALLQRRAKECGVPVMIVFEGWDTAGKGTMINTLLLPLDPRGFNAYFTKEPTEEELFRPFLWRFWPKTPARGRIAIFDQSWYMRVSTDKLNGVVKNQDYESAFEDINSFEKQLTDDGTLIIKLFLHIGKNEQKKRLKELEANPATSWKVNAKVWKIHERYGELAVLFEKMIERTDTEYAPWTVVEAEHGKFARLKVLTKIVDAMTDRLGEAGGCTVPGTEPSVPADIGVESSILNKIDLSKAMSEEDYDAELKKYQKRIREIEYEIYSRRIPIVVAYEGWDAAGKGGNIKRLVEKCDPRGYQVHPVSSPDATEKAHHYLWRFWSKIPKAGHIAIFDRTWYGRVLVERVEGFCCEADWKRAYREINDMEKQLTNFGTILVKFWLHIDRDEQLRRFEDRQNTPAKSFKITEEDWRNREKWDAYEAAVDEMLFRTNTTYAPWVVVESNDKYYARIKTLKTVVEMAEKRL